MKFGKSKEGGEYYGILLDMDGLLLDTEERYIQIWREAAKQLALIIDPATAKGLAGNQYSEIEAKLKMHVIPEKKWDSFIKLAAHLWTIQIARYPIETMQGTHHMLQLISKNEIPYIVATNSPRKQACINLESAGLQSKIAHLITRDEVMNGKPDPEIYLQAANKIGVDPEFCLVLEDSKTGIDAAMSAGATAIYIQKSPDEALVKQGVAHYPTLRAFQRDLRV